jgi:ketosteroid isomerase-like protein
MQYEYLKIGSKKCMGEVITMEELEMLVRKYYDAVDSNDLETLFSVFAENIVYERPGYSPIRGMDEFKDFYRNNRIIKKGKHTLHNIIVREPYVVVEGEFRGTLKDGKESYTKFVDVYTFSGKKAIKRHTYFDGQNV